MEGLLSTGPTLSSLPLGSLTQGKLSLDTFILDNSKDDLTLDSVGQEFFVSKQIVEPHKIVKCLPVFEGHL